MVLRDTRLTKKETLEHEHGRQGMRSKLGPAQRRKMIYVASAAIALLREEHIKEREDQILSVVNRAQQFTSHSKFGSRILRTIREMNSIIEAGKSTGAEPQKVIVALTPLERRLKSLIEAAEKK